MTQKIPEGFATITPSLNLNNAAQAIETYKKAFGAQELYRMECPGGTGKIMHACLTIGNSKIFLADAMPDMGCGPSNSNFYLYMDDVDAAFKQARSAGLDEMMPPADMFWGDRTGTVKDSFGNAWTIATHVRDVSPKEMEKGRDEWMAKMKSKAA